MRVIVPIAGGAAVIGLGGPMLWFRVALGVWLWGFGVRSMAMDRHWARAREAMRLSPATGFRIAFSLYIAAGVVTGVAGFDYLGRAAGSIVAFFMISWVWMCGWILIRFTRSAAS